MSRNPTVELWTLYAVGVSFTFVRTYARIVAVGVRELHPDDYLIWVAVRCSRSIYIKISNIRLIIVLS
ncbi:hypothetical protein HBI70_152930 [Parastagonospora nodorum]|nr:hypothetical protein HBI70_152930 [Parastagonospora nodorum]